jgi:hypothetical protein
MRSDPVGAHMRDERTSVAIVIAMTSEARGTTPTINTGMIAPAQKVAAG